MASAVASKAGVPRAALLASTSAPGKAAAYARRLSNLFFADSSEDDSSDEDSSDEDTVAAAHLRQRPLSLAMLLYEDTTVPLVVLHKELLASPSAPGKAAASARRLSNLFFADSSEDDSSDEDTVAAAHLRQRPLSLARLLYGDTLDEDSKMNLLLALADQEGGAASRTGGVSPRGWWVSKADGDAVQLKVAIPGLGKEHVKMRAEKDVLVIKGEDSKDSKVEGDKDSKGDGGKDFKVEGGKDSKGDGDKGSARYSYDFVLSFQAFKMDQIKAEMNNGLSAPHSSFGISDRAADSYGTGVFGPVLDSFAGRAADSYGSFGRRTVGSGTRQPFSFRSVNPFRLRAASYSTSAAATDEAGKAAAGGGGPGGGSGGGDGPTDCGAWRPELNPGGRAPDVVELMRRIEEVRAESLRNHAANTITLLRLGDQLSEAKASYKDAASQATRQVGVIGFRMCVGLGCFSFLSMVYYINQFGKRAQPSPPAVVVVSSSTPPPPTSSTPPPPTTSSTPPPPTTSSTPTI